ncbi:hypothetical protein [Variovorax sp. LG9.2]|uniref:hypothetical protein n=2 Tax=unclassified Variovorax TaxID=663243 RepID=UPI002B228658|nr:hypothetical protein [Variovorax sp. LG9.2]MEB0057743.1 hypothetical protein [Variovorax sp. LG9.2]
MQISAATIERTLAATRVSTDGQRKRRTGVDAAIRRSVPVRTFADWRDPPPGFFEVDMVEHCGGSKMGCDFVQTLTLTDIASGWTECVAMPVRNQALIVEALSIVDVSRAAARGQDELDRYQNMPGAVLPFGMLGVDTDNDSAFMNQTVFDYCRAHGLQQTRSRAYRKNDQAWVEQKNCSVVRRLVGYARVSGLPATRSPVR